MLRAAPGKSHRTVVLKLLFTDAPQANHHGGGAARHRGRHGVPVHHRPCSPIIAGVDWQGGH